MIAEIIYTVICIGYIILFAWASYLFKNKQTYHLVLFLILIIGLFYDGFIIGIGNLVGAGDLLKLISWPRFLLHSLLTPTCIIIVFELMVEYGIIGDKFKIVNQRIIIGILFVVLVLIGLFTHYIGIQIETTNSGGILRYTQTHPAIPPIATIIVSTILMIMGAQFVRKTNWKVPWILIGTIIIFFGSMIPQRIYGPAYSSSVELVLTLSMLIVYNILYKKE